MSNYDLRQKSHLFEILGSRGTDQLQTNIVFVSHPEVCFQMQEDKRQMFLEQKRRQQLRANNQELRELERQLKCAYVNKSLALQKQEQLNRRMKEKEEQLKETQLLEEARMKDIEFEEAKAHATKQKQKALRRDLQEQIATTILNRNEKFQEFLIDKKQIDDIVRKIQDEEMEEIIKRKLEKESFMLQYEEYKKQKEEILREMKLLNDDENRKIEEIIKNRDEESRKKEKIKTSARLAKEEMSRNLGMQIMSLELGEKSRRDTMEDLYVEEKQAKDEAKYRENLEQQIRKRISISISLKKYIEEKENEKRANLRESSRRAKEEQTHFREEIERLEKLTNAERIRLKNQRSNEIQGQLESRKLEREERISKRIREWAKDLKDTEKRSQIIEEERIEILQEHARNLMGFMPQGILRESDREFLDLPA